VGPRTDPDAVAKRKIPTLVGNLTMVAQPVVYYTERYPGFTTSHIIPIKRRYKMILTMI
jgi:hypothetical protein